jgi:hypothetical protein
VPGQQVAAVFSHRHFPGVRFSHRFHPDHLSGAAGQYFLLMRDIEEGGLHTMMEAGPSPDNAGVIWTVQGVLRALSSSGQRLKPPSATDGGLWVPQRRTS